MEMVSIPREQYDEFLQMRLELHLIYTKCRKDGVPEVMPDAEQL